MPVQKSLETHLMYHVYIYIYINKCTFHFYRRVFYKYNKMELWQIWVNILVLPFVRSIKMGPLWLLTLQSHKTGYAKCQNLTISLRWISLIIAMKECSWAYKSWFRKKIVPYKFKEEVSLSYKQSGMKHLFPAKFPGITVFSKLRVIIVLMLHLVSLQCLKELSLHSCKIDEWRFWIRLYGTVTLALMLFRNSFEKLTIWIWELAASTIY